MPLKWNPRADRIKLLVLKGRVICLLVLFDMVITSRGNQTQEINLYDSASFKDATDSTQRTTPTPQPTDLSSLYDMITTTTHPDVTSPTKYGEFYEDNEPKSSISTLFAGEDKQTTVSASFHTRTSTASTVEAEKDESPQTSAQTDGSNALTDSHTGENTVGNISEALPVSSSEGTHIGTDPPSLLFPSEETAEEEPYPPDEEPVKVPPTLNHTELDRNDSVLTVVTYGNTSWPVSPTTEDYNNTGDIFWTSRHTEGTTTTGQGPTLTEESPSGDIPQITPARGPTSPTSSSSPSTPTSTVSPNVNWCATFNCVGVMCYKHMKTTERCKEDMKYCELRQTSHRITWNNYLTVWEAGCTRACALKSPCSPPFSGVGCQQECCEARASSCLRLDGSINIAGSSACSLSNSLLLLLLLRVTSGFLYLL